MDLNVNEDGDYRGHMYEHLKEEVEQVGIAVAWRVKEQAMSGTLVHQIHFHWYSEE